jgi:repressor LexA
MRFFFLAQRTCVSYNADMSTTPRQQEILDFMRAYQEVNGFPPALREICSELGLTSPGSLIKHIRALELQGHLSRVPGKKRAWKLSRLSLRGSIPLIGQIAAGTPILAEENREDELPVDPKFFGYEQAFALRVRGDSMINAQIRDGDLAILRPVQEAENGEIVAVQVEGLVQEATLKIFRRRNRDVALHPANPAYEPLIFSGDDLARIKILGKLIGIIRARP